MLMSLGHCCVLVAGPRHKNCSGQLTTARYCCMDAVERGWLPMRLLHHTGCILPHLAHERKQITNAWDLPGCPWRLP